MTLPVVAAGESGAIAHQNALHGFYNEIREDRNVRYVTADGDDANIGTTPAQGFASIRAASEDLPTYGSGGTLRHSGVVEIGSGDFTETALPIEANQGIRYKGQKPSIFGAGTRIIPGADGHLFAPTPTFTDYAAGLSFENLTVDGDGRTGDFDLIQIYNGGFNCFLNNVNFYKAPRHGLHIIRNAITMRVLNCTWARSGQDDIFYDMQGSLGHLYVAGSEADNAGGSFLHVVDSASGQGHQVTVIGTKVEANEAGSYDTVIHYQPRAAGGGTAKRFSIASLTAAQVEAGGGTAVVFEENQTGAAAEFVLVNVHGNIGYPKAFQSDKTGKTSAGPIVTLGSTSALEVFA